MRRRNMIHKIWSIEPMRVAIYVCLLFILTIHIVCAYNQKSQRKPSVIRQDMNPIVSGGIAYSESPMEQIERDGKALLNDKLCGVIIGIFSSVLVILPLFVVNEIKQYIDIYQNDIVAYCICLGINLFLSISEICDTCQYRKYYSDVLRLVDRTFYELNSHLRSVF